MKTLEHVSTGRASLVKRLLLGRPLASEESGHQLLPKTLALPVFSSDALSSVAYATEEILLVLALAGPLAFSKVPPISFAIALLLLIVVVSYRQTVRAYPSGGGAYIVSKENLGETPGLVAAAALLVDYVLTVAVSIVAGVAAITSAAEGLADHKVVMSIGFIALITLANLRGVKESGTLFAVPTYAFVVSIGAMLAVGLADCINGCPRADVDERLLTHFAETAKPLSLFLILRAFASGSTALTGVEAISNGVPAFRRPSAKNAAETLAIMGAISIAMFVGISWLGNAIHVAPIPAAAAHTLGLHEKTIVAQIAETVFGGGSAMFFVIQAATAMILILAANTAYQDFPRLSSILARDRYMPRQFLNRGDRLVFSNGIIMLAILASLLVYAFDADVTKLIQLYVVGVFTSFTLSQTGMVRHWLKDRGAKAWRRSAIINGIGAVATFVVLVVVTATKFAHGAYIVIIAIPLIVLGFRGIHKHYASVAVQLRLPEQRPETAHGTHVVIPIARIDDATLRAIGYAKSIRPLSLRAVHVATDGPSQATELQRLWSEWQMGFPLDLVEGEDINEDVRNYVRAVPRDPDDFMTVLVPERLRNRSWLQFLRRRRGLLLKTALLFERQIVVGDVPVVEAEHRRPDFTRPQMPRRNEAVVLVSNVHNASLRAVSFAVGLHPSGIRAVTFAVDEQETEQIMEEWSRQPFDVALEILDSPYREVRKPLVQLIRQLRAEAPGTVVTVVIPEFVVGKWWHQFLHNQTALAIKARLLFEPDVVVTSVPFHLS